VIEFIVTVLLILVATPSLITAVEREKQLIMTCEVIRKTKLIQIVEKKKEFGDAGIDVRSGFDAICVCIRA
jgi:hypothetical protein